MKGRDGGMGDAIGTPPDDIIQGYGSYFRKTVVSVADP
jgi:hypothetical protein